MEMLDCSLDWSGCSSDLLVNKMAKWDCSLDSLESRMGLLASTGDSSGCSSATMAMAERKRARAQAEKEWEENREKRVSGWRDWQKKKKKRKKISSKLLGQEKDTTKTYIRRPAQF